MSVFQDCPQIPRVGFARAFALKICLVIICSIREAGGTTAGCAKEGAKSNINNKSKGIYTLPASRRSLGTSGTKHTCKAMMKVSLENTTAS